MGVFKALKRRKLNAGSVSDQPHHNADAAVPSPQACNATSVTLPLRLIGQATRPTRQSHAQDIASKYAPSALDASGQVAANPTANDGLLATWPTSKTEVTRGGHAADTNGVKKDYWQLAVKSLQDEDPATKTLIEAVWQAAGATGSTNVAVHLGNALEQSREALEAKRWRISIGAKEIGLREQYERLAKGLLLFKDALNVAAGLDPLHAGIPLAGFCVLLEVGPDVQSIASGH